MKRFRLGGLGIAVLAVAFCGPLVGCGDDAAVDNNNTPNGNNNNEVTPYCGNDVVELAEACDGADLDGETCWGRGYTGGTLACASDCAFDESGCTADPECGDGNEDPSETCDDGNNVSGDGCSADCQSDETCGNGYVDNAMGEACDDGNTTPGDGCGPSCLLEFCGNGVSDPGEMCDDGNNDSGDGCSADCQSDETCGNGYVDNAAGEACDDGNSIGGDGCSPSCELESCGNGHLDVGEACDDGNSVDGDGCSADCQSTEVCGNSVVDVIRSELCDDGNNVSGDGCSADCLSDEICGNGIVDVVNGEACDDGNTVAGDGCSDTCQLEYCGNGVVDPSEVCDDGNNVNGDGCSAGCLSNETCGNGVVDAAVGEQCDDMNLAPGDGCSAVCSIEICGNGVMDPLEVCDDGNTVGGDGCSAGCLSNETCGNAIVDVAASESCDDGNTVAGDGCGDTCLLESCGNGVLDPGEVCDDNNTSSGDGCSADCLSNETCGNGYVDGGALEQCDDGNLAAGDGCGATCLLEICGNGVVDPGEVCDDDNTSSGDGCSADCLSHETCGNGYVDTAVGEVCDDSNTVAGDGCSADCLSNETCGNGYVDGINGEVCDDSNTDAGDGCSADCLSDESCGNAILDTVTGETCDDGNLQGGDGCSTGCVAEGCSEAVDVSSVSFPFGRTGDFVVDPADGGSCDTTPNNAVYYTYTAPSTGWYTIDLVNNTTDNSFSRVAVFATTNCSPLGVELACDTANGLSVSTSVELTAGQAYLILFYTDGDTWSMEDPEISITPLVIGPGAECSTAIDVSGVTFPFVVSGTFDLDPIQGGTCDTTPDNAVFFRYTPTSSGWFQIELENDTTTVAYSRMVVFETAACSPYGPEVVCLTANSLDISVNVDLTAGQTYLILFHTDGDIYTMVDPQITIGPGTAPPPGSSCALPADTGTSNHYVGGGGEDCWSWTASAVDTVNDHDFSCDPAVGGDVVATVTTGPAQTALSFNASIANFEASGYVRVEVSDAPCASGGSLYCTSSSTLTVDTGVVAVTPNTTYYVWVADGYADHHLPDVDLCLW